jgi:hypothetical protein
MNGGYAALHPVPVLEGGRGKNVAFGEVFILVSAASKG